MTGETAAIYAGQGTSLLYDEMRRGNLSYVKIGRRRVINHEHLQQFLGLTSTK
jgi:hypothetical protein